MKPTQVCGYVTCDRMQHYRGLCSGHAEQDRLGKALTPLKHKNPDRVTSPCLFDQCVNVATARGLCDGHYEQHQRGKVLAPLKRRQRTNSSSKRDSNGCKYCPTCRTWLSLPKFNMSSRSIDGQSLECKGCASARRRLSRFNLTIEQYDRMLEAQGGGCAICGEPDPRGHSLAVDHDHRCCSPTRHGATCGGCVRGLLCWGCNTALGQMRDRPDLLRAAAMYLEAPRARTLERVG